MGSGKIGIIHYFKRSREGYLNKIELKYDEKKGYYVRKKFKNGFLGDCYSDFLIMAIAIPLCLKPQSGKSRQNTEAKKYREFNRRGFPVPRLLEKGEGYLDIEYIKMDELSRLLRDENESKQKKMALIRTAASELRKIHDAGFILGDANVHNMGCTPNGGVIFFDFEHHPIRGNRERDYSTFARSAAHEIPNPQDVRDILKNIAKGYGEDLTQKIYIVPYAYITFLVENKLKNLRELLRAIYRAKNW